MNDHREKAKLFKKQEYAESKKESEDKNQRVIQLKREIARVKEITKKI